MKFHQNWRSLGCVVYTKIALVCPGRLCLSSFEAYRPSWHWPARAAVSSVHRHLERMGLGQYEASFFVWIMRVTHKMVFNKLIYYMIEIIIILMRMQHDFKATGLSTSLLGFCTSFQITIIEVVVTWLCHSDWERQAYTCLYSKLVTKWCRIRLKAKYWLDTIIIKYYLLANNYHWHLVSINGTVLDRISINSKHTINSYVAKHITPGGKVSDCFSVNTEIILNSWANQALRWEQSTLMRRYRQKGDKKHMNNTPIITKTLTYVYRCHGGISRRHNSSTCPCAVSGIL